MGAALSNWEGGEGYSAEGLTRDEIIEIIGNEYYDEEKFVAVANTNDR